MQEMRSRLLARSSGEDGGSRRAATWPFDDHLRGLEEFGATAAAGASWPSGGTCVQLVRPVERTFVFPVHVHHPAGPPLARKIDQPRARIYST